MTDNLDPLAAIADDAQVAEWNNEGLPNDRMSAENAAILTSSVRWPLIVDPQVKNIPSSLNLYYYLESLLSGLVKCRRSSIPIDLKF